MNTHTKTAVSAMIEIVVTLLSLSQQPPQSTCAYSQKQSRLFMLLLMFALGFGYASSQTVPVKVLYRKGKDIFTISVEGRPKQITNDGIAKGFALWSKDGTKVAFLRKIDPAVALANLIVIDPETGNTLADIRICPTSSEVGYSVKYFEGIEWLTEDRIAAMGNVNPSTEETHVIDVRTGKEIMDYIDDDGGAVFSLDGEHVAYLNGSPHWTPNSDTEPELDIDEKRVFPPKGIHVSLLSKPAWSDDSTKVAAVVEDYQSKQRSLVVCGLSSGCKSTALPVGVSDPDESFLIQWNGGRVLAASKKGIWSLQPGDTHMAVSDRAPNLKFNVTDTPLERRATVQRL